MLRYIGVVVVLAVVGVLFDRYLALFGSPIIAARAIPNQAL